MPDTEHGPDEEGTGQLLERRSLPARRRDRPEHLRRHDPVTDETSGVVAGRPSPASTRPRSLRTAATRPQQDRAAKLGRAKPQPFMVVSNQTVHVEIDVNTGIP